jgi:hypothetical protein
MRDFHSSVRRGRDIPAQVNIHVERKGPVTLKSLTEQGGQVRPSKINCNCNPSGMPALEPVLPENCDELALRMEGLLCALGFEYQMSSNLGGIAIQNFAKTTSREKKRRWGAEDFISLEKGGVDCKGMTKYKLTLSRFIYLPWFRTCGG